MMRTIRRLILLLALVPALEACYEREPLMKTEKRGDEAREDRAPAHPECCFGMHLVAKGACVECRKDTGFTEHVLCEECALRTNRCCHCLKRLSENP